MHRLTLGVAGLLLTIVHSAFTDSAWQTLGHFEYKIIRENVTYLEAKQACESHNARLTSICNKDEEDNIINYLNIRGNKAFDIWIGYECPTSRNKCQVVDNWEWATGQYCNYTNWYKAPQIRHTATSRGKKDEPSFGDSRARLSTVFGHTTRWIGTGKEETMNGCICKKVYSGKSCKNSSKPGSGSIQSVTTHCRSIFRYDILWAKESGPKMGYNDAKNGCHEHNSTLTSICSEEEANTILNWLKEKKKYDVWLGYECNDALLDCQNRSNWRWIDGQTCDYTNWYKHSDEPSKNDNRARIHSVDGGRTIAWYGAGPTETYGYICKRALFPKPATTFGSQEVLTSTAEQESSTSTEVIVSPSSTSDRSTTAADGLAWITIPCLIVLLLVVFGIFCLWKRKKNREARQSAGDGPAPQPNKLRRLANSFSGFVTCSGRTCCDNVNICKFFQQRRRRRAYLPDSIQLQDMKPNRKRDELNQRQSGLPADLKYRRVRPDGKMMVPEGFPRHPSMRGQHPQGFRFRNPNGLGPGGRPQHPNMMRGPGPRLMNMRPPNMVGQRMLRNPNMPQRGMNPQFPRSGKGPTQAKPNVPMIKPPPDSDYKHTLEDLKNNLTAILDEEKITAEFKSIQQDAGFPKAAGSDPNNSEKNRFKDVLPYDQNRVKLLGTEADYINASYINGTKPRAFIATQGPKKDGMVDFWTMILQHRVNMIVMVTNIVEEKKRKCHQYWPTQMNVAKYGDIYVKCFSTQNTKNTTVRCFMVKRGNETRKIWQFQFRAWPDHGVPQFPSALLNFWAKMKGALRSSRAPVVVHCSAGIGRTGTFIALDLLLDEIQLFKAIDVQRCVTNLRKQRPFMVQNIDQYKFLYEALFEWITTGPTVINCPGFRQILPSLFKPRGKDPPKAVAQYQHICRRKNNSANHPQATANENIKKNRDLDILPDLKYSVKLRTREKDKYDYINAVFIDGYFWPNAYIATQAPLVGTKGDFWRMVMQNGCSVIVSLVSFPQLKLEEIYFPLNKGEEMHIPPLKITCKNKMGGGGISIRHLAFLIAGKERVVQHLCLHQPLTPQTAAPLMCKLHSFTTRWLHMFPKSRAVIHCLDGVQWTGVFCAALNIFDQIKCEGAFSIMEVVQNLRLRRESFIRNQAQYNQLFNLVQVYLTGPKRPPPPPEKVNPDDPKQKRRPAAMEKVTPDDLKQKRQPPALEKVTPDEPKQKRRPPALDEKVPDELKEKKA